MQDEIVEASEKWLQLKPDTLVSKKVAEDERLWSVTTILGILSKPGVEYWQREEVAKAFIGIAPSLTQRIGEDGIDQVIKWGIDAPYRKKQGERTAADLGTAFHAIAEEVAITGKFPTYDEELAPFVKQFSSWLDRAQPTFLASEMPVYSPSYGYAGTSDGILELEGTKFIFDFKTSRKSLDRQHKPTTPYPEAGVQLAAYRYAEYAVPISPRRWEQFRRRYYLFGEPEREHAVPVPEVEAGLVIHVTPEHCDAYLMRCDEEIHQSFLYMLEVARHQFEISKTIVGAKLLIGGK